MNKKGQLAEIAEEIAHCRVCQKGSLGKPVPGEGNPNASIMFIGEAPGKQEAETGRPFIGRSGQLLRKQIRDIGLSEDEVFITSLGKYLPATGTLSQEQIDHGKHYLWKQIGIIQPQLLVLLGSVASKAVLDMSVSVAKEHGKVINKNGQKYFISYHPAAAIRFVKNFVYFEQDFKRLKATIATL